MAQRPHYAIRVLPEAVNVFAREANTSLSSWEEDATGSNRGGVAGDGPPDGVGSEEMEELGSLGTTIVIQRKNYIIIYITEMLLIIYYFSEVQTLV